MRPIHAVAALLGAGLVAASCSHEWDDYDPRLGAGGDSGVASASSEGVGPSSSAVTATSVSTVQSSGSQGTGGGDGGAGPGPTPASSGEGGSSSTGTPTETLEIEAVEADCTDPSEPDPDDCDADTTFGAFTIDADASPFNQEWIGYLRFAPGNELAGKTIDGVQLRLVVVDQAQADADDSGEIWLCEAFDRNDLFEGAPEFIGAASVGASVGPVARAQQVTFDLVGVTVEADTPIYFAVDTNSMDGVDYADERSATPPTLVVTYH